MFEKPFTAFARLACHLCSSFLSRDCIIFSALVPDSSANDSPNSSNHVFLFSLAFFLYFLYLCLDCCSFSLASFRLISLYPGSSSDFQSLCNQLVPTRHTPSSFLITKFQYSIVLYDLVNCGVQGIAPIRSFRQSFFALFIPHTISLSIFSYFFVDGTDPLLLSY